MLSIPDMPGLKHVNFTNIAKTQLDTSTVGPKTRTTVVRGRDFFLFPFSFFIFFFLFSFMVGTEIKKVLIK